MNPAIPPNPGTDAATLVDLIREQCVAEVAALKAQHEERMRRIQAAADAQVESIRAAAQREGEGRGRRQAAKLLAIAEADSHLHRLWARETVIEAAVTRARDSLAQFAALPRAAEMLAALIREGLRALPAGPVRVRVAECDAQLLDDATRTALAAGRWTLGVESDAVVGGGVIVETEDGRLRFDNSIDARIRRRVDMLRRVIAEILFSEECA